MTKLSKTLRKIQKSKNWLHCSNEIKTKITKISYGMSENDDNDLNAKILRI